MNATSQERAQSKQTKHSDTLMIGCLFAALSLRIANESTAIISYILLAGYAFLGKKEAIQALAFSWLVTMLNPGLAPDANGISAGRYFVILAAAISVGLREVVGSGGLVKKMNFYTLLFGVFVLAHSIFFSAAVDVSVLKISAWVVVLLTLLSAWQNLGLAGWNKMFEQLQGLLVLLVLLSLPLLAIPSIGYLRNGVGFQGVLNHPQAFGPTVALLGALVGGRILGEPKPRWRDIALLGLCLIMVILSGARTAGLAMVSGLVGTVIFCPMFAGVSRNRIAPGLRSTRLRVVLVLCVIGVLATGPVLINQISVYLFKQSDTSTLLDAADASRGALVQKMIVNIEERPFTGIGFGVASNPAEMEIERDSLLGLPLSAVVEKGVMPLAVLEELGIFGAAIFLCWLFVILRRGARAGVRQFAVLVALLMVNFGEAMFFSVGGMGLLLLILLSGAVVGDSL